MSSHPAEDKWGKVFEVQSESLGSTTVHISSEKICERHLCKSVLDLGASRNVDLSVHAVMGPF